MASVNLIGVILDPNGFYSVGDEFRFIQQTTTGDTIKTATSNLIVPVDGAYNIELQYGMVSVEYKPIETGSYELIAIVTVNQDTTATTIPELLNAASPPTDEQLLQFQAILADATAQADRAEAEADRAEAAASSPFDPSSDQTITGIWDFTGNIASLGSVITGAEGDAGSFIGYSSTPNVRLSMYQGADGTVIRSFYDDAGNLYDQLKLGRIDATYQGEKLLRESANATITGDWDFTGALNKNGSTVLAESDIYGTSGQVKIGVNAGRINQAQRAVAIGGYAGEEDQSDYSLSFGWVSGRYRKGLGSISMGRASGENDQGNYSVAIGGFAGRTSQGNNGIIINSTGSDLDDSSSGHIHIKTPAGGFDFDGSVMDIVAPSGLTVNGAAIGSGGGVEEAPQDNKQYARQNATWTEVAGGGGTSTITDNATVGVSGYSALITQLNNLNGSLFAGGSRTIRLDANITLSADLPISSVNGRNITLDMNGRTINGGGQYGLRATGGDVINFAGIGTFDNCKETFKVTGGSVVILPHSGTRKVHRQSAQDVGNIGNTVTYIGNGYSDPSPWYNGTGFTIKNDVGNSIHVEEGSAFVAEFLSIGVQGVVASGGLRGLFNRGGTLRMRYCRILECAHNWIVSIGSNAQSYIPASEWRNDATYMRGYGTATIDGAELDVSHEDYDDFEIATYASDTEKYKIFGYDTKWDGSNNRPYLGGMKAVFEGANASFPDADLAGRSVYSRRIPFVHNPKPTVYMISNADLAAELGATYTPNAANLEAGGAMAVALAEFLERCHLDPSIPWGAGFDENGNQCTQLIVGAGTMAGLYRPSSGHDIKDENGDYILDAEGKRITHHYHAFDRGNPWERATTGFDATDPLEIYRSDWGEHGVHFVGRNATLAAKYTTIGKIENDGGNVCRSVTFNHGIVSEGASKLFLDGIQMRNANARYMMCDATDSIKMYQGGLITTPQRVMKKNALFLIGCDNVILTRTTICAPFKSGQNASAIFAKGCTFPRYQEEDIKIGLPGVANSGSAVAINLNGCNFNALLEVYNYASKWLFAKDSNIKVGRTEQGGNRYDITKDVTSFVVTANGNGPDDNSTILADCYLNNSRLEVIGLSFLDQHFDGTGEHYISANASSHVIYSEVESNWGFPLNRIDLQTGSTAQAVPLPPDGKIIGSP